MDLLQVYFAIVRSLIEYACPTFIGTNNNHNKRLEKIQKRALGIIFYGEPQKLLSLNIETTNERRIKLSLKFFNSLKSETHILHNLLPDIMQRTKQYKLPVCATSRRLNSFIPCTTILYNTNM